MFGIGTSELMIILAVGLIVIGPQKLPDLAKAIGRAVGEFRKATSEIKETLEGDENLASVKQTFEQAMQEGMKSGLYQEKEDEEEEEEERDPDLDNEPYPPAEGDQGPAEAGGEGQKSEEKVDSPGIEPAPDRGGPPEPRDQEQVEAQSETDNKPNPTEAHGTDRKPDA